MVIEAGAYFRLIDSCVTQLKAPGPSRNFDESKDKRREEDDHPVRDFARALHVAHARAPAHLISGLID